MPTETLDFNPFTTLSEDDPYPTYRQMRDEFPVYHHEPSGMWVLSRHADITATLRDWESFSNTGGIDFGGSSKFFGPGDALDSDPPQHGVLRKIIQPAFAPRKIAELEERIAGYVDELVTAMLAKDGVDVIREFSSPLVLRVVSSMLGVPGNEDQDRLLEWSRLIHLRAIGDNPVPEESAQAGREAKAFLVELVRSAPEIEDPDALAHAIYAAVEEGVIGWEEVHGLTLLLFVAGYETTVNVLGNMFVRLSEHADEKEQLRQADRAGLTDAVEEFIRWESPTGAVSRIAMRDVELHGTVIPKGSRVLLLIASGNRDERVFDDPDRFVPTRDTRRHLGFSDGIHHCVGATLARLELRIALDQSLHRLPEWDLAGPVVRDPTHTVRGLASVPVAWR